jgi:O-antigen ligase/Tfp pilus assembly protein PilF
LKLNSWALYPKQLSRLIIFSLLVTLPWWLEFLLPFLWCRASASPFYQTFVDAALEGRFLIVEWAVATVLLLQAIHLIRGKGAKSISIYTAGFYLFILYHVYQLFFSHGDYTSYHREIFFHYTTFILLAPILYHILEDYHHLRFLRFMILVGALLPTCYALWQQACYTLPGMLPDKFASISWLADPLPWLPNQLLKSRIISTFGNPNYFGNYLATVVLFLSPLLIKKKQGSLRLGILLTLLVAMLYCMIATKSRGAVLGLLAGGFGMLWFGVFLFNSRGIRWAIRGCLIVAMLSVFSGFIYMGYRATGQERLIDRIGEGLQGRSPSVNTRMVLWQTSLAIWYQHPVQGEGIEEFSLQFIPKLMELLESERGAGYKLIVANMESIFAKSAHNEYIQFLAEGGVIGLGLFLLFNIMLLWGLAHILKERARTRQRRSEMTLYVLGTLAALLCVLAQSVYTFPLRLPVNSMFYYIFCGVALALIRQSGHDITFKLPLGGFTRKPLKVAAIIGMLALCSIAFLGWGREYAAHAYYNKGKSDFQDWVNREDHSKQKSAERNFYKVLKYSPDHGETHYHLGRILMKSRDSNGARRKLKQALRTWHNTAVYLGLGQIESNDKHYAKARAQWSKLAEINPKLEKIHYKIGLSYFQTGSINRAREEFEKDLKYHSEKFYANDVNFYLGEIAKMDGEWKKAENYFLETLRISPNHFYANLWLAELYCDNIWNPTKMLDHLKKAKRIMDLSGIDSLHQAYEQVELKIYNRILPTLDGMKPFGVKRE